MPDLFPATAFFQDACALALENIVARLDRERGFQPYFKVHLEPTVRAEHDSWDWCDMAGRYVDALALIRQLTGLSAPDEEAGIRRFLLANRNPNDGLFYNQEGPNSTYVVDMFCQSRVLIGLCTWYMDTGDAEILAHLRGLVHGLMRIAERRDDYVMFPRNLYREGEWLEGGLFYAPKDLWSVKPGYGGTQLEGMMRYALLTGDEAVFPFVSAYQRYFLNAAQVVKEDGSFVGHLHSQGIVPTMVGAAMLAEANGDKDLLALCERFLRFCLSQTAPFGWMPDGTGWTTCETCAVGDVIHLAVRLSRLGVADFWDDVERIARNQLLENQFREPERVTAGRDAAPGVERIIRGSFASWAKPNDLLGGPDLEGCCTGGGVRALFHVLSNAVGEEPDGITAVRMLFSVETANISVRSTLPYEGRVSVTVKQPTARLKVRIPEGLQERDATVRVNGQAVGARSEGRYLVFESLPAGALAEAFFNGLDSVVETTSEVAGETYRVAWRGSSVVGIAPEGEKYPIYRRDGWRQAVAPTASWSYAIQGSRIRW